MKPRTLNDVDLMLDFEDPEKRGNALKELLKRTLKDAIPEATEEEINGIAMQHFNELVSAFMEVNGIAKPQ